MPKVPEHIRSTNNAIEFLLEKLGPVELQIALEQHGLGISSKLAKPCSMSNLIFEFREMIRHFTSNESKDTYESEINQFERFLQSNSLLEMDVDQVLTRKILGEYLASQQCNERTLNKKRAILSSLYQSALENQWITGEKPDILKTQKVNRGLPKAIRKEALPELIRLSAATKYGLRFSTLMATMLGTGGRIGEITTLKIGNIDWLNQTAKVYGKRHQKEGRTVFLGELTTLLAEYIRILYGRDINDLHHLGNSYVFSATNGNTPLDKDSVGKTFKRVIKKMTTITDQEKEIITTHCLRHTYATVGMLGGVDLHTLCELLGHSSVGVTQIYLSVDDNHRKEATRKMQGDLFLGWGN